MIKNIQGFLTEEIENNKQYNSDSLYNYSNNRPIKIRVLKNEALYNPTYIAYILARLSRKSEDIEFLDIITEIKEKNIDSSKRIDKIVNDYGHKSPSELADNLTIIIENVPSLVATRFHYFNYFYSSQESSTRYLPFENTLNIELEETSPLIQEYLNLLNYSYNHLNKKVKEYLTQVYSPLNKKEIDSLNIRTFDCIRGYLPQGYTTSFGYRISPYQLSREISRLINSEWDIEKKIGEKIKLIVQSEECDFRYLVKYTDGNPLFNNSSKLRHQIKIIDSYLIEENLEKITEEREKGIKQEINPHLLPEDKQLLNSLKDFLLYRLELCEKNQTANENESESENNLSNKNFDTINLENNSENNSGNNLESNKNLSFLLDSKTELPEFLFSSKPFKLNDKIDLGSFRDINRHRSLIKRFPLIEEYKKQEVKEIYIPEYINQNCELYKEFKAINERLINLLNIFRKSNMNSFDYMQLLPLGAVGKIQIEGDIKDWNYFLNLRSKSGGHISYNKACVRWLSLLKNLTILFKNKNIEDNYINRQSFYTRS